MQGIIHTYSSIRKQIRYNEKKVSEDQAECLYAGNFLEEAGDLSFSAKIKRFEDQMELNHQASRTGLQFFLAFSPAEKVDREKMIDVARTTMDRTGFGEQPYLVYNHTDAGRPHLHILTTKIRPDGSCIRFFTLRDWINNRMCRDLELELDLSRGMSPQTPGPHLRPPQKARYGERPTMHIIADILQYVLPSFNYRSFDQLNAILRLYNLTAKKGLPGSRLHSYHGLLYQVLDDKGKGRSTPVKASALPFKPTLSWLEQKFVDNTRLEPAESQKTRLALDAAIREQPENPDRFGAALRSNQVSPVPTFKKGHLTELFFIDLHRKIVLAPADLGPAYDVAALEKRLGFAPFPAPARRKSLRDDTPRPKRSQTHSRGKRPHR